MTVILKSLLQQYEKILIILSNILWMNQITLYVL